MSLQKGFSFDVATLLGLGNSNPEPLPEAVEGEIILRIPKGLTLIRLRDCEVGRELMYQQDWYEKYGWCRRALPAGITRLCVPVPGSFGTSFNEQCELLDAGEQVASITLTAVALLCIQRKESFDPLEGKWTRCVEPTDPAYRAALAWNGGRLRVIDYWDANCHVSVGLSSLRTS